VGALRTVKKKLQAWRDADAVPAVKPKIYYRLQAAFSATQVEPLPPPTEPVPLQPPSAELQGDSLAWAREPLQQLAAELGYRLVQRTLQPGHGGSCDRAMKVLTINDDQSINAQVSVTCPWYMTAPVTAPDRRELEEERRPGGPDLQPGDRWPVALRRSSPTRLSRSAPPPARRPPAFGVRNSFTYTLPDPRL
jgi:hypothetical protein